MSERLKNLLLRRRHESPLLSPENRWPEFELACFENGWTPANIQRVKEGYIFAQGAFFGQPRKTGKEWQFRHGERIGLNLITIWQSKDPVLVNGAVNHDTPEDTTVFDPPIDTTLGDTLWPTNSQKREFARRRMTKLFDRETARIIMALTRPEIDHVEIRTQEQADEEYLRQMQEANDIRVIVIKLEDRINNLEEPFSKEAHEKKKDETKKFYLPIFRRLLTARYKVEISEQRLARLYELLES